MPFPQCDFCMHEVCYPGTSRYVGDVIYKNSADLFVVAHLSILKKAPSSNTDHLDVQFFLQDLDFL